MLVQTGNVLGRGHVLQHFLGESTANWTLKGKKIGRLDHWRGFKVEKSSDSQGFLRGDLCYVILSKTLALYCLRYWCSQEISTTGNIKAPGRTCSNREVRKHDIPKRNIMSGRRAKKSHSLEDTLGVGESNPDQEGGAAPHGPPSHLQASREQMRRNP